MSSPRTADTGVRWGRVSRSGGRLSASPSLPLSHPSLPQSTSLLHPSSPRRPEPAPLPWLTSVKCGSLLRLFCRKPSPSTQLRRGPSTLQTQARAGSSAPAPCSAPCPDPRLGPSSAHFWLPAAGVVTGRSPSECLPLGTSSTISVCRGASMVQGPPPGALARTPTHSEVCRANGSSDDSCSWAHGPASHRVSARAHSPEGHSGHSCTWCFACCHPETFGGVELRHLLSPGHPEGTPQLVPSALLDAHTHMPA